MEPIVLFDKSFIEMLNHASICLAELHGACIEMDRRPVHGGGHPVRHKGEVGLYYQESAEMEAFNRWQDGKFLEVERRFASRWRAQLLAADVTKTSELTRQLLSIWSEPRNLDDAFKIAQSAVIGDRDRYRTFKAAYALLGLPLTRWWREPTTPARLSPISGEVGAAMPVLKRRKRRARRPSMRSPSRSRCFTPSSLAAIRSSRNDADDRRHQAGGDARIPQAIDYPLPKWARDFLAAVERRSAKLTANPPPTYADMWRM